MKGPFTAIAEISGPFKFDNKPVTIEASIAVTEPLPAAAKKNWIWVLALVVVIVVVVIITSRRERRDDSGRPNGRFENLG